MKKSLMTAAFCMMAASVFAAEANLALNKNVEVSSVEKATYPGKNAVDGKLDTRWASKFKEGEWIIIDLGSEKTVSRAMIHWEYAHAKEYKIQISNDKKNWKDLAFVTDGKPGKKEVKFNAQKGRYIRIISVKRGTKFGASIFEAAVFEK